MRLVRLAVPAWTRAREALKKYIEGGGGFVGIHNAFGTEYGWQWYEGLLGNANYYSHGANQDGDVVIVNDRDASTEALPERWGFRGRVVQPDPVPERRELPRGRGREHASGRPGTRG